MFWQTDISIKTSRPSETIYFMCFQMVSLFSDFVEKRGLSPLFSPYSAPKISLFDFILLLWQTH